jgi:uncharacterized membrane protein YdjX (TVP38/TMEM64 family)
MPTAFESPRLLSEREERMKRKSLAKIGVIAVVILLILLSRHLGFGEYFSLAYVKASQERLTRMYADNQPLFIGGYALLYIVSTALSLPWASLLTMLGGGIFGFWVGLIVVSLSSALGATLACAVSRFALRDWVQGRLGEKLKTVNDGIAREGPFYLFTLRLIPLFPFWMINLVMGLTPMPLRTYYWVSQVGMLPGTAVYVNAGKELGKIDSLSGILSPGLILSFVILGVFPLAVRKLMALRRARMGKPTELQSAEPRWGGGE